MHKVGKRSMVGKFSTLCSEGTSAVGRGGEEGKKKMWSKYALGRQRNRDFSSAVVVRSFVLLLAPTQGHARIAELYIILPFSFPTAISYRTSGRSKGRSVLVCQKVSLFFSKLGCFSRRRERKGRPGLRSDSKSPPKYLVNDGIQSI